MGILFERLDFDAHYGSLSAIPMPIRRHFRKGRCRKKGPCSGTDAAFDTQRRLYHIADPEAVELARELEQEESDSGLLERIRKVTNRG